MRDRTWTLETTDGRRYERLSHNDAVSAMFRLMHGLEPVNVAPARAPHSRAASEDLGLQRAA